MNRNLLLMLQYSLDLNPIFQLLSDHLLTSDLETIRDIAAEITAKMKRFSLQKQRLEEG